MSDKPRLIEIKEFPMMWWSGDARVEPFMKEVSETLDKEITDRDSRVRCYNRCYEAVYNAIKHYDKNKE